MDGNGKGEIQDGRIAISTVQVEEFCKIWLSKFKIYSNYKYASYSQSYFNQLLLLVFVHFEVAIKKALRMGELDKVYRNTFIFPCIVSVPV